MAKSSSGSTTSLGAIVALTVIAVGLFVATIIFVARASRLQTDLTRTQTEIAEIVGPGERNNDTIQALVSQARAERKSLVSYLSDSMRTTMRRVAGTERETAAGLTARIDAIPGAADAPLLSVLRDRDQRIESLSRQLEEARGAAAAAQADLQAEVERINRMVADQQSTVAAMNAQIDTYKGEVESYRTATTSTIDANNRRVEDIRRESADQKAAYEDRISKLQQESLILAGQLEELRGTRAGQTLRPSAEESLVDGRVVSVNPGDNSVFIDLSRADRVVLGMTFEVYDTGSSVRPGEDGEYPPGKATVEIIRVGENSSAARILRSSRSNPVVAGDVIVNPVYDPTKVYTFVLAGDFDTDRDRLFTPAERQEVAAMIRAWGGIVQDDVGGSTDFLILGERPRIPPQPPPDAPIAVINEYIRLQRAAREYDRLFETARQTGIPVLNQSRLYTLTGRER